MFTLEQKVDLILRYIATTDDARREEFRKLVVQALCPEQAVAPDIEDLIINLFREIGVPEHQRGYDYIVYATKLAVEDRTYLSSISKRLYPAIAERFDTTYACAERRIRGVVETIFTQVDSDSIVRVFGNTLNPITGKLTNREFIAASAHEITRRMKQLGIEVGV